MVQYADNSQQELVPKEHIFSLAAASTEGQANFHTATSDRNTENGVETCPEATKADDHEISFGNFARINKNLVHFIRLFCRR